MRGIAIVATGVFVALAVAQVRGELPRLRRRRLRSSAPGGLALLLRRAGSTRQPSQIRLIAAGAAGLVVVATWSWTGIPMLAVVPGVLTLAVPHALLRRRAASRVREVRLAWPDALAQIGGSVRAGRPLSHALIDVSLNGPAALRTPLAGLAARIQTVGMVPALQAVADAVGDPVTDRVVEVMCLAHAEGGRIVVDVVGDLADSIAAEVHAGEEVETLSLEGRLNARMVFALPWMVLVVLTVGDGPFRVFYASAGGAVVIGIGALLSLVGLVVVGRLSRPAEEPRVLRVDGGRR